MWSVSLALGLLQTLPEAEGSIFQVQRSSALRRLTCFRISSVACLSGRSIINAPGQVMLPSYLVPKTSKTIKGKQNPYLGVVSHSGYPSMLGG